jgi:hypothetical protein
LVTSSPVKSILVNVALPGPGPPLVALINTSATDSYIDPTLVHKRGLPLTLLGQPITVTNFDGKFSSSGKVTHTCVLSFKLENHCIKSYPLLVLPLPKEAPIILGFDFLSQSGVGVDFKSQTVSLRSPNDPSLSGVKLRVLASSRDLVEPPAWVPNWVDQVNYTPPNLKKCRELLPEKYHDHLDVFSKANAESLPQHTEHDIKIELLPDTTPPPLGESTG